MPRPALHRFACLLLLLAPCLASCRRGPTLPASLQYRGRQLETARSWAAGGIKAVVFVPPGQRLPTASLQVGVLTSERHPTATELHRWMMEQYHRSPTLQLYEDGTSDEACKIGVTSAESPTPFVRPFVALHICRGYSGASACAEIDEVLDEEASGTCIHEGTPCWDEVCTQRWLPLRAELETILAGVLKTP